MSFSDTEPIGYQPPDEHKEAFETVEFEVIVPEVNALVSTAAQ